MLAPRIDQDDELNWLALRLTPGLGARRAGKLIQNFGSPAAVFQAATSDLQSAGVPGSVARSIASGCSFEEAVIQHQRVLDTGATLVPIQDPHYPPRLKEIHDPPILLFARGRVELLQSMMVGVVGTRRPTPYGLAVAERLAADLSNARLTIVSGMARGIDTAAHRAALDANGKTIAVFGCGVDLVYPAENRKLATRIVQRGLVLSEFPMGTPSHPQNFPVRNRIISGMSLGVLVVEGAQYSGSSITAKLAMEQQREVFAVPGNITSKMSWGPNLLIKQGAHVVQEWTDVIEALPAEERRRLVEEGKSAIMAAAPDAPDGTSTSGQASLPLSPARKVNQAVLARLAVDRAIQLDDLMEDLKDISPSEVIAALFELEMEGSVRQLAGKNFVKVW